MIKEVVLFVLDKRFSYFDLIAIAISVEVLLAATKQNEFFSGLVLGIMILVGAVIASHIITNKYKTPSP